VKNAKDFLNIDISKASHSFEVSELKWIDIQDDFPTLAPDFLLDELRLIDRNNIQNNQTKVIIS